MTKIEWTEVTWNPVTGCSKVSEGCRYCYAERQWSRVYGSTGRGFTDVKVHEDRLGKPYTWQKPRLVFVNSMSDLFHRAVSADWIARIYTVMAENPRHTFQVLTKRPDEAWAFLTGWERLTNIPRPEPWPVPNVWLGVSAEDQRTLNARLPTLSITPAAVRWLSLEPLLDRISLEQVRPLRGANLVEGYERPRFPIRPDWIVVGGESGPKARPMAPEWARQLRDECQAASIPFFFKQWGECDAYGTRVGKKAAGRVLDGVEWSQIPTYLPPKRTGGPL